MIFLVGRAGFEPATNGLKVRCGGNLPEFTEIVPDLSPLFFRACSLILKFTGIVVD
jgi:hypothetical protein